MEKAYPQGYGLSAITGLTEYQVNQLIDKITTAEAPVYLANINSEDQMVIAGKNSAMDSVLQLAKEQGARKIQRLAVSVPSHCLLLNRAAEVLYQALLKVDVQRPNIAYLSGNNGRVWWQPMHIRRDLACNMANPVRWHEAMISAYERNVRLAVELPPGTMLTGLASSIMKQQEQGEAISVCQSGIPLVEELVKKYYKKLI